MVHHLDLQCACFVVDCLSYLGVGLKSTTETIDNRGDFKTYMQNYAFARGGSAPRGPRREGPSEEGFVSGSSLIQRRNYPMTFSCRRYQPSTTDQALQS